MTRSLVWVKPEGAEVADVELDAGRMAATGSAIGGGPIPYRLEYELTTGERYVTARLAVRAHGTDAEAGPWRRWLELVNRPEGEWTVTARAEGHVALPPPGGDAAALRGALDCDLGLSPLTNTMPVLRGRLLDGPPPGGSPDDGAPDDGAPDDGPSDDGAPSDGAPVEHLMAWVSVPDLVVTPSRQTYRFVRRDGDRRVVRFSSPGFTEEIVFDQDGLVVDYPSIGRAVSGP
ncbi:putative glycolipid-binding domain-containing protein [Actinomadura graeca]|uniref:Glycolipid-binding domain-containing protein n=1 Tax=Actinomadura graeca TaxID=2750812 RepID=A0ABX8R230_9ACTN|nr:putative glycolipid-binding domain-containing protein [Actinomadura graeca]QXJ25110.1 putative glycolipid-binding domain-containing protein [Actinomadura graeca]